MTKPYLKQRKVKLMVSLHKRLLKLSGAFSRRKMDAAGEIAFNRASSESSPREGGITAILNMYARSEYLPSQIEALRNQTRPPDEIWVWCNRSDQPQYDVSGLCDRLVVSNHNWKFFGRFALALMAETKYVALFDDDMLPQPGWLKSCLETASQPETNGILGGCGIRLPVAGGYSGGERFGWPGSHCDDTVEVDLVGHTWFMEKDHLRHMWREEPYSFGNGEDIHLSYSAQKYGGIKTFVPPHPPEKKEIWSSDPIEARARGGDAAAHSIAAEGHSGDRDAIVDHCRGHGWKIVAER